MVQWEVLATSIIEARDYSKTRQDPRRSAKDDQRQAAGKEALASMYGLELDDEVALFNFLCGMHAFAMGLKLVAPPEVGERVHLSWVSQLATLLAYLPKQVRLEYGLEV